ncbi:transposase, partial [Tyzzerella sp. OttesenSCG-928-J15]|nr:transposase [Tyzzerella sp. OttesenSCG-928-J15]
MLKREQELRRNIVEILCMEERIPKDHLLRQIDVAIDFGQLYDYIDAANLYSSNNGRPSIDPVVLFKIVLIQHLYGISSLRRTMAEIDMNIA